MRLRLARQASAYTSLLAILPLLAVLMGLALSGCTTVTDVLAPSALRVSIDVKDYHQGTTQVAIHFAPTRAGAASTLAPSAPSRAISAFRTRRPLMAFSLPGLSFSAAS